MTTTTPPDLRAGLDYTRTVDRALVHREALGEVFLTDVRADGPDGFAVAAQLPRSHAYYGDHLFRPVSYDPVLLMETCRQAGLLVAHAHYGVPRDHKFILTRMRVHLTRPGGARVGGLPCALKLLARVTDRREREGAVTGLEYRVRIEADGGEIGHAELGLRFRSPDSYRGLRLGNRGGEEPPSSTALPRLAVDGAPAHLVGRADPDNAVVGDLASAGGRVTGRLRVPAHHPSMFDHPQDHLPGMVLVEAARQLALYAALELRGRSPVKLLPVDIDAVFHRFGELDRGTELAAVASTPEQAAPSPVPGAFWTQGGLLELEDVVSPGDRVDRLPVAVDIRQGDASVCTVAVELNQVRPN